MNIEQFLTESCVAYQTPLALPDPGTPGHCPGKFWSIVLIALHGNSAVTYRGSAACVACPDNLTSLKLPLPSTYHIVSIYIKKVTV